MLKGLFVYNQQIKIEEQFYWFLRKVSKGRCVKGFYFFYRRLFLILKWLSDQVMVNRVLILFGDSRYGKLKE